MRQYYTEWGSWFKILNSGNTYINDNSITINGTSLTLKTLSSKSHSGWTNNTTDDKIIPTMSMLAYWNGAHTSSGASNLTYCIKGAFGDAAVKGVTTSVTSGSTSLVTSGGVYTSLSNYVTLNSEQSITGYKTFTGSVGVKETIYLGANGEASISATEYSGTAMYAKHQGMVGTSVDSYLPLIFTNSVNTSTSTYK